MELSESEMLLLRELLTKYRNIKEKSIETDPAINLDPPLGVTRHLDLTDKEAAGIIDHADGSVPPIKCTFQPYARQRTGNLCSIHHICGDWVSI